MRLRAKQRTSVTVPLSTLGRGRGRPSKVQIAGPGGFALERSYALDVKPATQVLTRRTVRPIARGESLTLSNDLFADLVPGTGAVALSVGASTALDAATLLKALDRYPFGCSEQITSRALPLLYVNELASGAHLALDDAHRPAHPRRHRPRCWRASRRTARSASGASAATTPGSTPTSPTS